jgi:hypothetical protein
MIHPITFAFPESKLPFSTKIEKTSLFSDLSPFGGVKKYTFFKEDDYYAHYAKSYFAVTAKKAGWDCLRHYEIAASGTLPYFLDIELCPEKTLHAWPKKLLQDIKKLPGLPMQWQVRRAAKAGKLGAIKLHKKFDPNQYWDLHAAFMEEFHKNLTSRGLTTHVLKTLNVEKCKLLFLFGIEGGIADYQRDLLMGALASDSRISCEIYPKPFWLLESCHEKIRNTFYGRGFTYSGTLNDQELVSSTNWAEIEKRMQDFDFIFACSSSNQGYSALPEEVQKFLSTRNDVIWIDGNDIKADHSIPPFAKLVFRREMDREMG